MSYHDLNDPIVWIDCEMTGLDPRVDELVEISVVVTDGNLQPVDAGIDIIIKPSDAAVAQMNDFVRDMHTSSGLINEWETGVSVAQAQRQVLAYLKERVPEGKAPLGGNSVGTDKTFLIEYMPELVDYLHYRIIDVSSIKELTKRWYPKAYFVSPEKFGHHRALGDIYDSIDELRYYRAVLFPESVETEAAQQAAHSVEGETKRLASSGAGDAGTTATGTAAATE
ncbi:oligoribonuclease [Actinotignum sp. GS-2025a]|uniref:oligoribonuclease n=1 Tax=Actinotignum TaxID=1653174 RepID=UPI00254A7A1A|nr:oligoribonuclease [Actinotignum timonense]MDK6927200.1 oligoribonuclease [Actinotignum timonense]